MKDFGFDTHRISFTGSDGETHEFSTDIPAIEYTAEDLEAILIENIRVGAARISGEFNIDLKGFRSLMPAEKLKPSLKRHFKSIRIGYTFYK